MEIRLSNLNKTWIFDLDGTLVKHNGHLRGRDELVDGITEFIGENVNEKDFVVILTARNEIYREETVKFLKDNNIRYDEILFRMPTGERILINDRKPSGLVMAHAINTKRDCIPQEKFIIDDEL